MESGYKAVILPRQVKSGNFTACGWRLFAVIWNQLMLVGVPMVTYLQLFGALFIVAGLFVLGVARGGIHEVLSGVLIVGGSLMLGQAALIERMEKQLRAQEKLLDIWQEFEKSRKGGS